MTATRPALARATTAQDAIDKTAYLPGRSGPATSANVSNYSRGINGIMVNLQGGGNHAWITLANILSDFSFKMGNNNSPSTWATAPSPISVSVRAGAGVDGSDRVELIWADNAIKETWLEVIVKADSDTGLVQEAGEPTDVGDVFFFGNAAGDDFTGESTIAFTNATDDLDARAHTGLATITNVWDYNKDGFVNASDSLAARVSGSIRFIKVGNPPAAPEAAPAVTSDSAVNTASVTMATPAAAVGSVSIDVSPAISVAPTIIANAGSAAVTNAGLRATAVAQATPRSAAVKPSSLTDMAEPSVNVSAMPFIGTTGIGTTRSQYDLSSDD